jgi:plasmid stabilization system protein ParE
MSEKVTNVIWTRQAREAISVILQYRYKDIPTARKIVRADIIVATKQLTFTKQFQKDDIYPIYRRIVVRDYKILYKEIDTTVYIMNVVCTKAL